MDEKWVRDLKAQFPAAGRTAFFDIAYENCGSAFVAESAGLYFSHKADIRPGLVKAGGAGKGETIGVIARARERLASFLGAADIRNIAFTANTCQGINLVLQGFPFAPGDNIVVGDLEHRSVLMPCLQMKTRGVEVKVVHAEDSLTLSAQQLLAAADDRTRVVVVSAVQSAGGYRIDLPLLSAACHARGIYVVTDAIQLLGFKQADVRTLGADALASSCYKGMLAAEGLGFLYVEDGLLAKLSPVFGGDSPALSVDMEKFEIVCPDPADARKFETGTIPFEAIYGLDAALSVIGAIGMEKIDAHVSACYEAVYRGLAAQGFVIDTPFEEKYRCHSMAVREERSRDFVDFALGHGVYLSDGRCGHFRVSVAPFTTEEDIERLLAVTGAWRRTEK